MGQDWKTPTDSISPLLEMVLEHVPAPEVKSGNTQMLITSLDYSPYTGRVAIGRLNRGTLKANMNVCLVDRNGEITKSRIKELNVFDGLGRRKVEQVQAGDICAIIGLESFNIGDTTADALAPEALLP